MDEYRKIQKTPAKERPNGTSAGVFCVRLAAHVFDQWRSEFKKNSVLAYNNRNGNYFLKNIIN